MDKTSVNAVQFLCGASMIPRSSSSCALTSAKAFSAVQREVDEDSSAVYVNCARPSMTVSLATTSRAAGFAMSSTAGSDHQNVRRTFSTPPGQQCYVEPSGYHDPDCDAIALAPGKKTQTARLNSLNKNVSTSALPATLHTHWNLHHVTNLSYDASADLNTTFLPNPSGSSTSGSVSAKVSLPEKLSKPDTDVNVGGIPDDGYLPDVLDASSVSSATSASYAYAYDAPPMRSAPKVFTNAAGQLENIYEEISDLERQQRIARHHAMLKSSALIGHSSAPSPRYVVSMTERRKAVQPADFHRRSLVEEVLDEVARVQQRHLTALGQLNLDVENLIMPDPHEQSNNNDKEDLFNTATRSVPAKPSEGVSNSRFTSNCPSPVSSTSFEHLTHHSTPTYHAKISRYGSLDLKESLQRRSSASAVVASSSASATTSDVNARRSLRSLQQGLHRSFQDLQEFRDKCSHVWNRRGKKTRFQDKEQLVRRTVRCLTYFFVNETPDSYRTSCLEFIIVRGKAARSSGRQGFSYMIPCSCVLHLPCNCAVNPRGVVLWVDCGRGCFIGRRA